MFKRLTILRPAVGVEPEVIVPHDENWKFPSVRSFLTVDATPGNREVRFIIDSPGTGQGTYTFVPSNVLHAPSEARTYDFIQNAGYRGAGALNVGVVVGIGDVVALGGDRVRLSTTNLQPGDQWQELFLTIEVVD